MVAASDWNERGMRVRGGLIGTEFPFCKIKILLEIDCTTVEMY